MEFALEYKVKQSKNGKFPSHYKLKLAQLILKLQFPSAHKPLRILAPPKISPSKGHLKNISPGAYFRNFTVFPRENLTSITYAKLGVGV